MCMTTPILLKQLNDYKKPPLTKTQPQNQTEIPLTLKSPPLSLTVKLINFEFYPKKVKIPKGTIITWEIGPNQPNFNSIYSKSDRSFFLYIEEIDLQSPQLYPGSSFSHQFLDEGVFEIICLNYSRVKSIITVLGDGKTNEKMSNSSLLPIHYNKEIKIAESYKDKEKNKEITQKSYLNEFPNNFFSQIDQESDFQTMDSEILYKKDTSGSDTKTNEPLDSTNPLEIELKEEISIIVEETDINDLIKGKTLVPLLEIETFSGYNEKEIEAYERVKSFLQVRYDIAAFLLEKG